MSLLAAAHYTLCSYFLWPEFAAVLCLFAPLAMQLLALLADQSAQAGSLKHPGSVSVCTGVSGTGLKSHPVNTAFAQDKGQSEKRDYSSNIRKSI